MIRLFTKKACFVTDMDSDDIGLLANIHEECFDHVWSADDIASTLGAKGTRCLVAKPSGKLSEKPKGFIMLRALAGQGEVLTIAVEPKYRKRGYARALMEQAIALLNKDQCTQFFLEVSEANSAALALYVALGFKQISVRKGYYSNQITRVAKPAGSYVNALVMRLDLR